MYSSRSTAKYKQLKEDSFSVPQIQCVSRSTYLTLHFLTGGRLQVLGIMLVLLYLFLCSVLSTKKINTSATQGRVGSCTYRVCNFMHSESLELKQNDSAMILIVHFNTPQTVYLLSFSMKLFENVELNSSFSLVCCRILFKRFWQGYA